ncbi:MAG: ABC transporter permease [Lactococcus sp.]|nr:ABC transporter permease [Lactococcus sp.]MDN5403157.1 ABC transporter permease [Lactococcus sp.]MDN5409683.1 ABC transporter permease [Lactococcus sp.]MDN5412239.1 ABC transporter permease [Lactococcus sp.]MDN5436153.1 ABC transporter permease [Lactococcus sp.]MDN5461286.1 ABC transporter permease [Lactococcus sp.]
MKKRFKIIFLKQDLLSLTTIVLWFLSFLSGFSIIFSRSYLSGGFRVDNVYAMFSMFSNYLLIYMSVQLFGKEFKYSTINSIRICGRSHWEIIVRKLAVMLVLAILTAILSFLVLLFDHLIFNQLEVFGQLLLAYVTYSIFLFALGSLIIFLIKRTLHAFIAIFLTLKIAIALMNVLSSFKFTSSLIHYIPLSFLEDSFSFARYTPKQVSLTLIWSAIMLGVLSMLYRKRGFK